ncbi:MAG TPA: porphobilinogen synthase, partial [Nitrospirota bacterium]
MFFPAYRGRRVRANETIRRMVRETVLSPDDFIYPMFVTHGKGIKKEISSMPGCYQQSMDNLVAECKEVHSLGIPAVILFGIPKQKDPKGSEAYSDKGIVQQAIKAIKDAVPGLMVITDVCLCEYTDHGHCGIVIDDEIVNDPTVEQLVRAATSHAAAGADIVAPSDMMDGRVGAIRRGLDERGFENVAIMSYAAKYCSAFYGPFRDAAASAPKFGDRRSHQM